MNKDPHETQPKVIIGIDQTVEPLFGPIFVSIDGFNAGIRTGIFEPLSQEGEGELRGLYETTLYKGGKSDDSEPPRPVIYLDSRSRASGFDESDPRVLDAKADAEARVIEILELAAERLIPVHSDVEFQTAVENKNTPSINRLTISDKQWRFICGTISLEAAMHRWTCINGGEDLPDNKWRQDIYDYAELRNRVEPSDKFSRLQGPLSTYLKKPKNTAQRNYYRYILDAAKQMTKYTTFGEIYAEKIALNQQEIDRVGDEIALNEKMQEKLEEELTSNKEEHSKLTSNRKKLTSDLNKLKSEIDDMKTPNRLEAILEVINRWDPDDIRRNRGGFLEEVSHGLEKNQYFKKQDLKGIRGKIGEITGEGQSSSDQETDDSISRKGKNVRKQINCVNYFLSWVDALDKKDKSIETYLAGRPDYEDFVNKRVEDFIATESIVLANLLRTTQKVIRDYYKQYVQYAASKTGDVQIESFITTAFLDGFSYSKDGWYPAMPREVYERVLQLAKKLCESADKPMVT